MADTYASRVAAGLAAGMSLTKLTLPEGVTSTGALALEEVLCERSLPSAAFALLQPQLEAICSLCMAGSCTRGEEEEEEEERRRVVLSF